MKSNLITAVVDSIIRPNACFSNVSGHAGPYFRLSVLIFAIAGASALLSEAIGLSYLDCDGKDYLGFSPVSLLVSVVHSMLGNFVMIAAMFWIGKNLGGSTSFKTTFSVLSFCLIPGIIAALVIPLALTFASQVLLAEVDEGITDLDSDLSPRYVSDFASSAIISNGFAVFFGAWVLILFLKATKIVNSFDIKKSIITVVSGIVILFLSQAVFGMLYSLLPHL